MPVTERHERDYKNQIKYLFIPSKIKRKGGDLYIYINVHSFDKPNLISHQHALPNNYN